MIRSRFLGHMLFWLLLLAAAVAFDTLADRHVPPTLERYVATFAQPETWLDLVRIMTTVYSSLWVFTRYALPRQATVQLPLVLGQILLLGVFDIGLRYGLLFGLRAAGHGAVPAFSDALREIPRQLLASWLFVMLAFVFKQLSDRRRNEELLSEKNAIELAYLKAQLNPHFLFNSMNNLYGLALSEPERTPDAILMLAQLMRYMLYESNANYVSLAQEVSYLHSYIALEKLRYEGPVYIEFTSEGDIDGLQIAPLLLICFVENAFKHGTVSNQAQPVQLHLAVRDDYITFTTRNQIVAKNKDLAGGVGLPSVRRRLALLYPHRHQLTLTGENGSFCCVLELDARTRASAPAANLTVIA